MSRYAIRALDHTTWDSFVRLAEKHNGVWNGCWCTAFHPPRAEKVRSAAGSRSYKERLVREGKAHAALVFDGEVAVGWCQYGTPDELPNIYHRREYESDRDLVPDYRITCFFVDRDYRRSGIAALALDGAIGLIAEAGGGTVEAYPQDTQGRRISASFLYNGTRSLFEQAGFRHVRAKGKNHCVVRKVVSPKRSRPTPDTTPPPAGRIPPARRSSRRPPG